MEVQQILTQPIVKKDHATNGYQGNKEQCLSSKHRFEATQQMNETSPASARKLTHLFKEP